MAMIEVDNLTKEFHDSDGRAFRAVDGLSFQVEAGQIYGLLGPNGAGKTTSLRMLSALMTPSSGRITVNGYTVGEHVFEIKQSIGFLTANTGLYQRLSPRDVLRYFGELHGFDKQQARDRCEVLIREMDITDFSDQRCGTLSTGQKQRTNIARALIADPPVLIMDEPTLGLDVMSNRVILDFIIAQREAGKAIILSTHYLDEAETMCDMIGLLHRGRIVAEGTIDELRERADAVRLSSIFLKLIHAHDPLEGVLP